MKYKITIEHFNRKTSEMELTETLSTKDITEQKLADLVLDQLAKSHSICWTVSPRPKNFEKYLKGEK